MIELFQDWLSFRESLGIAADVMDFIAVALSCTFIIWMWFRTRINRRLRKIGGLEITKTKEHERTARAKSEWLKTVAAFRQANRRRHTLMEQLSEHASAQAEKQSETCGVEAIGILEDWWENERKAIAEINGQLGEWYALFAMDSGLPLTSANNRDHARALALRHLLVAAELNQTRSEWTALANEMAVDQAMRDITAGELPTCHFAIPVGLSQGEARAQTEALNRLAGQRFQAGAYWDCYLLADQASLIATRNLPSNDVVIFAIDSRKAYALMYAGHSARALTIAQETWEAKRTHPDVGERHPDTLASAYQVADILSRLGRYEEALAIAQPNWEAKRTHPDVGERHPDTLASAYQVADILSSLGRYEEALAIAQPNWEADRTHPDVGERHPSTLTSAYQVASILSRLGRYEEALAIAQPNWEAERTHPDVGERHPSTLASARLVAHILSNVGQNDEALTIVAPICHKLQNSPNVGPRHRYTLQADYVHALVLFRLGQHEMAKTIAEETYSVAKELFAPSHELLVDLTRLLEEMNTVNNLVT